MMLGYLLILNWIVRDVTIPHCPRVIVDGEDPIPVFIIGDPASVCHEVICKWRFNTARTILWIEVI